MTVREYRLSPQSTRQSPKVQPKSQKYKRIIVSSTTASPIVFLLTTVDPELNAASFARTLVEEKLAACVSVLPPMTSVYRWKGAIEEAREQQLLIKTTAERIAALEHRFRTLHPYELPEFVVMKPDQVSALYREWVIESVAMDS
jgi:periplasmic divalent cation tolerance protein